MRKYLETSLVVVVSCVTPLYSGESGKGRLRDQPVSAGSRTAGTVHNLVHGTVCTLAWLGVTRPDPGVVLVV